MESEESRNEAMENGNEFNIGTLRTHVPFTRSKVEGPTSKPRAGYADGKRRIARPLKGSCVTCYA